MLSRYDIALGKKPKPPTLEEEMAFLRDAYERAAKTSHSNTPLSFLKNIGQLYKDDQISKAAYDKMMAECSAKIKEARAQGRSRVTLNDYEEPTQRSGSGCGPSSNASGRC